MKQTILLCLLIFILTSASHAQNVHITGNAKTYAGDSLYWSTYSDQITFTEEQLGASKVDKDGDFEFKISIDKPTISFIHLNVFKGILYLEPGKSYHIVLPQKVKKLTEDELNPFFEETEFFIRYGSNDSTDLNFYIRKFDKLFDASMAKSFKQFKGKVAKSVVDSMIRLMEDKFPMCKNEYFNNYRKYSYASFRLMAYERNKERFMNQYFTNKKILFNNPAYMDLFNKVFKNHLSVLYRQPKGKAIPFNLIRQRSLSKLKATLDSFPYLANNRLQDLVILKSLFDNFYKEDFPQKPILFMIDSIELSTQVNEIKTIAQNIKNELTQLLPGYDAPDFKLQNIKGKLQSLKDFRGGFVYLNFCNPDSYTCQRDFRTLQKLNLQQYEKFNLVTICVCNSLDEMKRLVKNNKYNWTFLYLDKNTSLLKDYNIRVYPSYYLINPEGKLVMSPAFPPEEASFEARYFDNLKAWKKELLRREAEKKKKGLGQH